MKYLFIILVLSVGCSNKESNNNNTTAPAIIVCDTIETITHIQGTSPIELDTSIEINCREKYGNYDPRANEKNYNTNTYICRQKNLMYPINCDEAQEDLIRSYEIYDLLSSSFLEAKDTVIQRQLQQVTNEIQDIELCIEISGCYKYLDYINREK